MSRGTHSVRNTLRDLAGGIMDAHFGRPKEGQWCAWGSRDLEVVGFEVAKNPVVSDLRYIYIYGVYPSG